MKQGGDSDYQNNIPIRESFGVGIGIGIGVGKTHGFPKKHIVAASIPIPIATPTPMVFGTQY